MISLGIDVAKNKHDGCILDEKGNVLQASFSFKNNQAGFQELQKAIENAQKKAQSEQIKAGLEATGIYSLNLEAFLRTLGIKPVVFNPLQVNLFRKSKSLRRTKTDKADAKCIAQLLRTDESNPVFISYQMSELKSLTRHRFRLVGHKGKLKQSICRLLDILFPELSTVCSSVTQASIKALLLELPGATQIADCRIDRLENILRKASRGRYKRQKALQIKELAQISIGIESAANSFALQQTVQQLNFLQQQIRSLEKEIKQRVFATNTPLLSIPGIGPTLAAILLAEIGDIHRFSSPDKLQAFAGLDPSTYQSGQFQADHSSMVKHGSSYLRWAVMQAARLVSIHCRSFRDYMKTKKAQGKHYFVALGHTSKKLLRVIFRMLNANIDFVA